MSISQATGPLSCHNCTAKKKCRRNPKMEAGRSGLDSIAVHPLWPLLEPLVPTWKTEEMRTSISQFGYILESHGETNKQTNKQSHRFSLQGHNPDGVECSPDIFCNWSSLAPLTSEVFLGWSFWAASPIRKDRVCILGIRPPLFSGLKFCGNLYLI